MKFYFFLLSSVLFALFSCTENTTIENETLGSYNLDLEMSINSIPLENGFIQFRTIIEDDLMKTVGLRDNLDTALYIETSTMDNFRDTTFDINGDGLKDYIYHYYPINGCCPRKHTVIHLNESSALSKEGIVAFNALINQEDGVVYTMDYGFPAEIAVMKNQWKESVLFPRETLSLNMKYSDTNRKLLSPKFRLHNLLTDVITYLDSIPREYETVPGIHWLENYEQ